MSAAVGFVALVAASGFYLYSRRHNRKTHYFDVVMRTAAVYKDELPPKRVIASTYVDQFLKANRDATPAEQLAVTDLIRYFDTASWRAFRVYGTLNFGRPRYLYFGSRCSLKTRCEHGIRRGRQQFHETIRVMIKEIGFPAYMYYELLEACGQDDGKIVVEASLTSQTEFRRMHDRMKDDVSDLLNSTTECHRKPASCSRSPAICICQNFIDRERQAMVVSDKNPPAPLPRERSKGLKSGFGQG